MKRFCQEYARNPNATTAALSAGYSKRTAYSQGNRLLKNAEVQNYLQELTQESETERIADAAEIRKTWSDIMRNSNNKPSDRNRAAELLMKSLDGFVDHSEVKIDMKNETEMKIGTVESTRIYMPKMANSKHYTAIQTEDGTIIPLSGHENDEVLFYYNPDTMPLYDECEWTDPEDEGEIQ